MNLTSIKSKDTIIAPSYLHTYIRNELLKDRNGIIDVTILTFETYFNFNNKHSIFDYYKITKNLDSLQYHKENINKYEFIKELVNFIKKKHQFHFSYDHLDTSNNFLKEMKDIILSLDVFKLEEDYIYETVNNTDNYSSVYILDEYCNPYKSNIYSILENKGATRLHFDNIVETKEYYHSLNKRMEIESLAQYIIQNDLVAEDINIQVCDQDYNKFIDSIFYEYNIPYSILNDKNIPIVCVKYNALLNYYLNPNLENSMALYQRNVLKHQYATEILNYMDLHRCTLDHFYTLSVKESEFIDDRETDQLKALQDKAILCRNETYGKVDKILKMKPMDALLFIDEFLVNNHYFHNNEERKGLLEIRKLYEEFNNPTKQDLAFMATTILKNVRKQQTIKGCNISDLKHPLPNNKYLFILGASQDNFPAFNNESGIFDEYTFASIKEYPTQEERYNTHMEQILRNLNTCKHLVVSYSTSTFDGKAKEESLDMKTYMEIPAIDYPYYEEVIKNEVSHMLEEDTAFKLFTRDSKIYGSVSSIEQYGACPYKYFLSKGLYLKEPIQYGVSVAKVGTLMHYVMEQIAKKDKHNFQNTSIDEIKKIIDTYLDALKDNYPAYRLWLEELKTRVEKVFVLNMKMVKECEENHILLPEHKEYEFNTSYQVDDDITVELKGIIDRIDESENAMRIVDYKSSSKELKEEKVFSGQQLQLLTYATTMEETLNKELLGAFYYSFKNDNINAFARKVSRNKITVTDDSIYNDAFVNNKRFTGWITSENISLCDANKKYIKRSRPEKIYNSKVLKEVIEEIYTIFAAKLLFGKIDVDPTEGTCKYCPYACICRNTKGQTKKKDPWIEVPENLYIKGGKK